MVCQRWFEDFERQADLDDSPEFARHCQQCAACRAQWERWRQLELDCWAASELFANADDQQATPVERGGRRSDRPSYWLYWVSAMCAMVLLAIGWFWAAMMAKPNAIDRLANSQHAAGTVNSGERLANPPSAQQSEAQRRTLLLKTRDELLAKMKQERIAAGHITDRQQPIDLATQTVWPPQGLRLTGTGLAGQPIEVAGARKFQVVSAMIWFETKSQELDSPY